VYSSVASELSQPGARAGYGANSDLQQRLSY